ncbi:hypothetical protein ACF0H5_001853 [Mactra antiquata]
MEDKKKYSQVNSGQKDKESKEVKKGPPSRLVEQCLFVSVTLTIIALSHGVVWAHWMIPFIYATVTPVMMIARFFLYKLPDNSYMFQVAFALANGPVLVAAIVYGNELVLHNHDKMTSCYIHILPALLTFSVRWYPTSISKYWFKSFVEESPSFDMFWLYAVPFGFFFLHTILYLLIVNVIVRPTKATSYEYLANKFGGMNFIGGPWGQAITFYGFNWLFCLVTLGLGLLSYYSWASNCAALAFMFFSVLWNGANYYVNVFSEHGFNSPVD